MSEVSPEKQTTIVLHDCKVALRGKGVKDQTQDFQSFGLPIYDKKDKKKEGPVSEFSYAWVKDWDLLPLISQLEGKAGLTPQQFKEGIVSGLDEMKRSKSKQAASETAAIVEFILQEELTEDEEKAEKLAIQWQRMQRDAKAAYFDIPSIDRLAIGQRKYRDSQIEKGLWKSKLVKKDVPAAETVKAETTAETTAAEVKQ